MLRWSAQWALAYQKAPEDFLAAMRRCQARRHWRLGRRGRTGRRIGDLASKQRAGRVVLAGERADVQAILAAFDVFALPSRYEGLPTAVVEAMMCGIPVVATAVNAVSDVVVPGETGLLVPPRRPDLLADAVGYLLDRPVIARRMADAARARLGDRFGAGALRAALTAAYADQTPRGAGLMGGVSGYAPGFPRISTQCAARPAGRSQLAAPGRGHPRRSANGARRAYSPRGE